MRKSHSFLIVGILVFAVGCDQLGGAPAPAPAPPAPPPPAVVAPATPRAVETDDGPQDPQERSEQNLGKIAAAMNQYLAQHGQLPAAANYNDGRPMLSWRVHLLLLLGEDELYHEFHHNESWDSPHNQTLLAKIPSIYKSPERADENTNYLAPAGAGSAFANEEGLSTEDLAGLESNTVVVLEVDDAQAVPWTRPGDHRFIPAFPRKGLGNLRDGGFLVAMADGSAQLVGAEISDEEMRTFLVVGAGKPPAGKAGAEEETVAAELTGLMNQAWRRGEQDDAFQYQYVLALISTETESWTDKMGWVTALKRPAIALRWGIGINYKTGRGYRDQPYPILEDGTLAQDAVVRIAPANTRGGNTGNVGSLPAAPDDNRPRDMIAYYTGQPGELLLEALEVRSEVGQFGPLLADVKQMIAGPEPARRRAPRGRQQARGRRGRGAMSQDPLMPGVELLGEGSQENMLNDARGAGIDLLLMIDVNVQVTRNWLASHTLTFRVVNVDDGETLHTSRPLNNIKIYRSRESAKRDDPVDLAAMKFGDYVDEKMLFVEMPPALRPKHVLGRVQTLTSDEHDNPLPVLTEIRYYHTRSLITDEELADAYAQILGDERAQALITGTPEQKKDALRRWTPRH